jgi:serine protease Do
VVNLSATRQVDESEVHHRILADPSLRDLFRGRELPELPGDQETRSLGSGVIVGADGTVLTSAHMVEKADQVDITLSDGREVDGVVVGTDARSDLAVVRIQDRVQGLVPLPIGDSGALRLGEVVLAVGNPFGVGQTVSMGIVSATGRTSMGIVDFEDFIQTDAAINPGSSGGALVNARGELVGINTAILSRSGGSMGIGFAIPTAMASPIMKSLLAHRKVTRGFLGAAIQDIDRALAESLDLTEREGALVSGVTPGSPAEAAGLARGDVIRSMNGRAVRSSSRFRNEVAAQAPGTPVRLEVMRDGRARTVVARLDTLKEPAEKQAPRAAAPRPGLLGGVAVTELTPPMRGQLGVPNCVRGVVVTEVEPGARAEMLGLHPGDVVVEVDRKPIDSVADFRRQARGFDAPGAILVHRDGTTAYLAARR